MPPPTERQSSVDSEIVADERSGVYSAFPGILDYEDASVKGDKGGVTRTESGPARLPGVPVNQPKGNPPS